MEDGNAAARDAWNGARFRPGSGDGHYESWFQRANHPSRPLAFWIRYTIFQPAGRPGDAVGELWAVWFDGETGRIAALREAFPLARCRFATDRLEVTIGRARLSDAGLSGEAAGQGHRMAWDLRLAGGGAPLLLLPRDLYDRSLPKAKALVGSPNAIYDGRLAVDGLFLGQQQLGLEVGQPGGHHQVVGGQFQPELAGGVDEQEILVGERQDRDVHQVDFLIARQHQEHVDRAVESAERQHQPRQRIGVVPGGVFLERQIGGKVFRHQVFSRSL